MIEAPMGLTRLTPDAVPSIMPNCPAYLTDAKPLRQNPDAKRTRQEAESLQEALARSLETQQGEEEKYKITNFKELMTKLCNVKVEAFWTAVQTETCVMFIHVEATSTAPEIRHSVTVSDDLSVRVYWKTAKVIPDEDFKVPDKLVDLRMLSALLDSVQNFKPQETCQQERVKVSFKMIFSLIEDILNEELIPQEKLEALLFLREQLQLVSKTNSAVRYSAEILIFASILYTISPHAYRFIRSSTKVILPHPSTIASVCNSYDVSPAKEQKEEGFLNYTKRRVGLLQPEEKKVTLMMDEIHIHQYLEYKGGSVTGAASNSSSVAKTAHVFMIQSLLSAHKDVVHILPVLRIDAEQLHQVLRRLIVELEDAGLLVVAVISDNNAINRKTMSLFSPVQTLGIVFPHPADSTRPLFYIVDPVHLLKCIRNNWLNQKNPEKCIFYPNFETIYSDVKIDGASFVTLRQLHASEQSKLVKFGYGLSFKALNPSNMERQNVNLALKVFSAFVAEAVRTRGEALSLSYVTGTSNFIELILKWWHIVNVKSPSKGRRLLDPNQEPVQSMTSSQLTFLSMFVDWLDVWSMQKIDTGLLSNETHSALRLTTHALIEVSRYCFEELGFSYVLLGKFQTDCLEDRFGKYRQLAGSQYHVSIQQVFESEAKIRLQDNISLRDMKLEKSPEPDLEIKKLQQEYTVNITDRDISSKQQDLPIITYIAGFCAHAALKRLLCDSCRDNLTVADRPIQVDGSAKVISDLTRGALKFPKPYVINAVLCTQIVLEKLTATTNATKFLAARNQRAIVIAFAKFLLSDVEDLDICANGHTPHTVLGHIARAAANTLLNNYVKMTNDNLEVEKGKALKRKLKTLK